MPDAVPFDPADYALVLGPSAVALHHLAQVRLEGCPRDSPARSASDGAESTPTGNAN